MRFLEKQSSCSRSMVLLAPRGACLHAFSGPVTFSDSLHSRLIGKVQRLRGDVYLKDGALHPSRLTRSGRHFSPFDKHSWHLLTVRSDGAVLGCIRFLRHPNTITSEQLRVAGAPLARSRDWRASFFSSLDCEIEAARQSDFSYVEIGGWALAQELRGTREALQIVLSTYALAQLQGGALGITTATERNGSASILRRLGGRPLEWGGAAVPPYFDRTYNCGMQVLRFDSRRPSERYASSVDSLKRRITHLPVFCPGLTFPR